MLAFRRKYFRTPTANHSTTLLLDRIVVGVLLLLIGLLHFGLLGMGAPCGTKLQAASIAHGISASPKPDHRVRVVGLALVAKKLHTEQELVGTLASSIAMLLLATQLLWRLLWSKAPKPTIHSKCKTELNEGTISLIVNIALKEKGTANYMRTPLRLPVHKLGTGDKKEDRQVRITKQLASFLSSVYFLLINCSLAYNQCVKQYANHLERCDFGQHLTRACIVSRHLFVYQAVSIVDNIQHHRLRWLGHVIHMTRHCLPRRVLFSVRRKPRIGQRLTWQKGTNELVKRFELLVLYGFKEKVCVTRLRLVGY
ncbi:hypothetical protein CSKR_104088 [Clonorchis sinensis]|uniref:Uncharacterized protein n=1 Tax=Clonorchis sinensis TaxID=79923 RepID=A0A3R7GR45_CLOSI|nr:hypothetical protein CSKR_104088 [Clonorchis sinensis]